MPDVQKNTDLDKKLNVNIAPYPWDTLPVMPDVQKNTDLDGKLNVNIAPYLWDILVCSR